MFFVTVVSEVLQKLGRFESFMRRDPVSDFVRVELSMYWRMPPLLIWANTLLHSAFFIALTVVNDYPSDSPSLELQLLMVIVRIACGNLGLY